MHKTTPFSRWRRLGLLALLGATASVPALAQKAGDKWPERPVRLVVNFAPGGAADVLARAITPTMSQVLGQTVRSEEHTSELQSPCNLVCRLLLEKKKRGVVAPVSLRRRVHRAGDDDLDRRG